jgi:hypothetical protein
MQVGRSKIKKPALGRTGIKNPHLRGIKIRRFVFTYLQLIAIILLNTMHPLN